MAKKKRRPQAHRKAAAASALAPTGAAAREAAVAAGSLRGEMAAAADDGSLAQTQTAEKQVDPFGEMGRCLLSSTMLQNGRGIRATFEHFERAGISKGPRPPAPRQTKLQPAAAAPPPLPPPDAGDLRDELERAFADFLHLASNDTALLATKLEQQRRHNFQLRKRHLRRQARGPSPLGPATQSSSAASSRSRWLTPLESGYDSDSTTVSTSTSATATEPLEVDSSGRPSTRGKVLLRQSLMARHELRSQAQSVLALLSDRCTGATGSSDVQQLDEPKRSVIVTALQLLQRHLDAP